MEVLSRIFRRWKNFTYEGPNAGPVHAMNDMALRDNDANRERLYSALIKSTLIVPTPELPESFKKPGKYALDTPADIRMIVISDNQGRRVTPAFTDSDALRVWDPNVPSFAVNAQEFFRMVLGAEIEGVVINPFDPIRKMIRSVGLVSNGARSTVKAAYSFAY